MQQNLPPEEWIVLMQQIVDGTEACFYIVQSSPWVYTFHDHIAPLFREKGNENIKSSSMNPA